MVRQGTESARIAAPDNKPRQDASRWLRLALAAILLLWIATPFFVWFIDTALVPYIGFENGIESALKRATPLGDIYGVVNSLFSGCALAFLVYAIIIQTKQLETQQREVDETVRHLRKQAEWDEIRAKIDVLPQLSRRTESQVLVLLKDILLEGQFDVEPGCYESPDKLSEVQRWVRKKEEEVSKKVWDYRHFADREDAKLAIDQQAWEDSARLSTKNWIAKSPDEMAALIQEKGSEAFGSQVPLQPPTMWKDALTRAVEQQRRLAEAQALLMKLEDYQRSLQEAYDRARGAEIS